MRKAFSLLSAATLLAGCALAQGTMLTDNTARITSRANSLANRDRVIEDALAEAARLTRAKGFRYFTILEATDDSSIGSVAILGQITRNKASVAIPFGNTSLGVINRPGTTFVTSATRVQVVRPGLNITIRMYREGEVDPRGQGVWNAETPLIIDPIAAPAPEPPPAPRPRRRTPSTLRG
jgi:hypothetical protein